VPERVDRKGEVGAPADALDEPVDGVSVDGPPRSGAMIPYFAERAGTFWE
jgi:hypothetical protein